MFVTLTPNPALDTFYTIDQFDQSGGVHRLPRHFSVPGGKGINTARALARLGQPVAAYGFLGGYVGQAVEDLLAAAGIRTEFLWIEGTTRICTTVTSVDGEVHFELLEQGPIIAGEEWCRLGQLNPQDKWKDIQGVVVAGNPQQPAAAGCLAHVLQQWHLQGIPVVLDMRAPWLLEALPWADVVKINTKEWVEAGFAAGDQTMAAAERLLEEQGLRAVILSDGSQPLLAVTEAGCYTVEPPPIHLVSAVGCGDTMNAGIIRGLAAGHAWETILVDSTALAAANACSLGAAVFDRDLVVALQDDVNIQRIQGHGR